MKQPNVHHGRSGDNPVTVLTDADRCHTEAVSPDPELWNRIQVKALDRHFVRGDLPLLALKPSRRHPASKPRRNGGFALADDPLKAIEAEVYLEILVPATEPARGRCRCPLPDHEDRNPSGSYRDVRWYCHRCARGGDIYTLGAELYGLSNHGRDFLELRQRLAERILGAAA